MNARTAVPLVIVARAKAAGVHLGISLLVAALAAWCVFALWFPYPYLEFAGGRELFTLVVSVDVVCGPLLTFVVFNSAKPRRELVRDLVVISFVQLAALIYGMQTVALARPVLLAFEVDRFRVVTAADVDPATLGEAPSNYQRLSWSGPRTIAVRVPKPSDSDFFKSLDLSLAGLDAAVRPSNWRDYDDERASVLKKAKPLKSLKSESKRGAELAEAIAKSGLTETSVGYLPVQGHRNFGWIALVDLSNAHVVGFAPIDGF